jgi:hypothetical protein
MSFGKKSPLAFPFEQVLFLLVKIHLIPFRSIAGKSLHSKMATDNWKFKKLIQIEVYK